MDSGKPSKRPNRARPAADQLDGAQDRASNLRLGNLTPEQAMAGIFKIKPDDVKRIVGSKPEKKTKGKGK